jgi:hypothetical protein
MTKMLRITQDLNYIQGHLKNGHLELEIEKEKWDGMTEKERHKYFSNCASTIVDNYEIDDYDVDENEQPTIEEL